MDGVQFKETLQTVRERWPNWSVNTTEIKDLSTVFMGEAKQDVDEALFMVRKKYSSDVPRLPWFYAALDEIKGKRSAEAERLDEQDRLRKEMQDRELEEMECNKEHTLRKEWLRKQPDGTINHAMSQCAQRGYIQQVAGCNVDEWTTFTVGMVYSYMNG